MICLSDTESVVVGKRCGSLTSVGSAPREDILQPSQSQGRDEGKLLEGEELELALGKNFLLPMLSEQPLGESHSSARAASAARSGQAGADPPEQAPAEMEAPKLSPGHGSSGC